MTAAPATAIAAGPRAANPPTAPAAAVPDAYNQQQEVIKQVNIQKALNEGKSLDQATAEANLKAEVEKVNEQYGKQIKALHDLYGLQISQEEAAIKTREALAEYNKSLSDGSLTADQRKQKELDLEKALLSQSEAAVDAAVAPIS